MDCRCSKRYSPRFLSSVIQQIIWCEHFRPYFLSLLSRRAGNVLDPEDEGITLLRHARKQLVSSPAEIRKKPRNVQVWKSQDICNRFLDQVWMCFTFNEGWSLRNLFLFPHLDHLCVVQARKWRQVFTDNPHISYRLFVCRKCSQKPPPTALHYKFFTTGTDMRRLHRNSLQRVATTATDQTGKVNETHKTHTA